jgi:hypothetical protein
MGARPVKSRTGSISRTMVAAQPTMANVASSRGLQPVEIFRNTDGLLPLEDGGSESDIVEKILSGAFGP